MNKIRFRAVFETDHIWIEDVEWPFFVVDDTTIFDARKDKYKEIKVKAVLQYAVLKDKNGEEICEGDRIKEHPNGHTGVIKKDMGNFYVEWDNPGYPDWSWNEMVYDHMDRIEIIGNIYDGE